jgi:hypothetical protein
VKDILDGKQNKLKAGDNKTIDGDRIFSSDGGGITQEAFDSKQDKLDGTYVLSVNRVSALGDIASGGNLIYFDNVLGSRNVKDVFFSTNTEINGKQNNLNFLTNLSCAIFNVLI